MSVDTATFKIRFPEFVATDDARVQLFIDDAVAELSEISWGTRYDLGTCYLAAHLLAIGIATESGDPSGLSPLASGGADGLSVSFARSAYTNTSHEYWQSTAYGKEFMRLKRTLFAGARVAKVNS